MNPMVGGIVCGISVVGDEARVRVVEVVHWNRESVIGNRTCVVVCKHAGKPIKIGDSFWWQAGSCYWTPRTNGANDNPGHRGGVDYDIELQKVGYSHDGGNYDGPELVGR